DNGVSATDRGATLVTRQYYTLTNDPANRNRMFGGMQDNGTNRRPDAGGTAWDFMTGGDGFGCTLIPTVPSIVLTSVQYEKLYHSSGGGDASPSFTRASPLFDSSESTPFATTLTSVGRAYPQVIFTGGSVVWKSVDGGESWLPLPSTTTDGSSWDNRVNHEITS